MSKSRVGIAILVVAAVLSSAALARGGGHGGGAHGGGGHGGGGHFGGGHGGGHGFGGMHFGGGHGFGGMHFGGGHHAGRRFAVSHSFSRGGFHGGRSFAGHGGRNFGQIRNAPVRSGSIRSAMNSLSRTRRIAQWPLAQQSRRAGTDRRGCRIGGLARRRPGRERMVAARRRRIWMGRAAVLAVRLLRHL